MDNIVTRRMDNTILRTHYEGCWRHEGHHACAVTMVEQLWTKTERLCHELHNEQVRRDEWEKMYNQAITGTEVERLRAELATVDEALGEFFVPNTEDHGAYHLQSELAKVEAEVKRLQNWLAIQKQGRDREYESAKKFKKEHNQAQAELALTRVKLNRVRQDAQDQSDEVQELWLSPCEAEGLKRQLAKAEQERDQWCKVAQQERAWVRKEEQRAKRAEALAALVNEETAELLEWLLRIVRHADVVFYSNSRLAAAGELAAHIREALGETE